MPQCLAVMINKPYAESADRNGAPILDVLRDEFSTASSVIEIGSGTGQHAARFAAALQHLRWQTSDLRENHEGINAWVQSAGLDNLIAPLSLDVRNDTLSDGCYDAAYSANTAHIMSIESVEKMFSLLGGSLKEGGVFCLYGPFRQLGEFNTQSNAAFDQSLRARDPAMGIRDLETLDQFANTERMVRQRLYAMPANNHIAVWKKASALSSIVSIRQP